MNHILDKYTGVGGCYIINEKGERVPVLSASHPQHVSMHNLFDGSNHELTPDDDAPPVTNKAKKD